MTTQQTSRPVIVIHRILGILASVLGYFFDFIFGITLLFGGFKDIGSIIVALLFIALGTWLIILGIKSKRRISRFKKYVSIISLENQTSLENIASSCSQSLDFVAKDLELMIKKKFFINAYIDKNTNEIILGNKNYENSNDTTKNSEMRAPKELKVVTCKNCGASNKIAEGSVAECEFCGSAINS